MNFKTELTEPHINELAQSLQSALPRQLGDAFENGLKANQNASPSSALTITSPASIGPLGESVSAIRAGIASATLEGNKLRNERIRQGRIAFNIAASMVTAGTLTMLIAIGAVAYGFVHITTATISGLCGIVINVMAALPYKLRRDVDRTLKTYEELTVSLASVDSSLQMAQLITDPTQRDAALRDLIEKVSQLPRRKNDRLS